MLTAHARIETPRAARYLEQLCRHAGRMQHARLSSRLEGHAAAQIREVEQGEAEGTLRLGSGNVVMRAGPDALRLRAEADGEERLGQIQELVGRRIETLGSREGLVVVWTSGEEQGGETPAPG